MTARTIRPGKSMGKSRWLRWCRRIRQLAGRESRSRNNQQGGVGHNASQKEVAEASGQPPSLLLGCLDTHIQVGPIGLSPPHRCGQDPRNIIPVLGRLESQSQAPAWSGPSIIPYPPFRRRPESSVISPSTRGRYLGSGFRRSDEYSASGPLMLSLRAERSEANSPRLRDCFRALPLAMTF